MNRAWILIALTTLMGCRSSGTQRDSPHAGAQYELRFSGNEAFSEGRLRETIAEEIADFDRDGPSRPEVDDAAYTLAEFHRSQGFHEARVSYEYDAAQDTVRIRFEVREGPRAIIEKIRLEGDLQYDPQVLEKSIGGPRGGVLGTGELYFVESEVLSGVAAIRTFYFTEGYLTARVSDPEITFDESRERASVRIEIQHGPRFRVESVEVEGELESSRERVEKLANELLNRPFTPRVPYSLRASVIELYARQGFPDAAVTFQEERDTTTGAVRLVFTVIPGERVTVKAVEFEGQDRTKESFLASRMKIRAGERYDGEALRESFRNLYRTGLFHSVRMELVEDEGAERTLLVTVEEAPAIELSIEPGYGSYEGPRLSLGAENKNFLGSGKRTKLETTGSPKALTAIANITDPWLFGSEFIGSASLIYSDREEPSFESHSIGTILSVSRQWTKKWRNSIVYTFRDEKLDDVDVDDPDAQDELDDVDVSSLALVTTRNSVDGDIFFPRSGSRSRLSLEWADSAIGSEIDFNRLRFEEANYYSLGAESVFALSLRTGVIQPVGDTDVIPLQERFFNGGENTVRSFKESELGPKDDDDEPLGGEAFTVLSAELRRRIVGNFSGAVFYDTGNVVQDYADYFELADFRAGVGLGVRYMLPIGPLRLDVSANPNPKADEDEVVAHFAIGMSF